MEKLFLFNELNEKRYMQNMMFYVWSGLACCVVIIYNR